MPGSNCNSLDILVIPSAGILTRQTYHVDPSSFVTVSGLTFRTSPSKLPYTAKSKALSYTIAFWPFITYAISVGESSTSMINSSFKGMISKIGLAG